MSQTTCLLKVFLCHSSGDKPTVREIHRWLSRIGAQPWLDEEDLLPGQDWDQEIRKAIPNSDVILVCLSKSSTNKTGYLQKEIKSVLDAADEHPEGQIFIIPLKLEECEVPERLRKWQWVNLYEQRGYEKLLQALQARARELDARELSAPKEYMFDIFLSYNGMDSAWSAWVDRLRRDLQERGVKVWLPEQQNRPGNLSAKALDSGLESSRAVGLVITDKGLASGWVEAEYNRALSLTSSQHLQLIPVLVEGVELPKFLTGVECADFRSNADYDGNIDRLVWPGITGHNVIIFASYINREPYEWPNLIESINNSHVQCSIEYEPDHLRDHIVEANRGRYRTVVISYPFGCWPGKELDKEQTERSVREIFELRDFTRNTAVETVFVLYTHPDALAQAPHQLDKDIQQRLRHYFLIPMMFCDTRDAKVKTTEKQVLQADWKKTWYRVQNELLRSERRFFGNFPTP